MRTYTPKEWPYTAKAARDGAAEETQKAITDLVPLTDSINDAEILRVFVKAIYRLENALRHLESAGAQTRPPEP